MSATVTPQVVFVRWDESDEALLASGSLQFAWMAMLYAHLAAEYRDDNVFVAANHLIYPVEGDNKTRQAPDVFVAFGRPKVERGSYRVWEEEGIVPQVIFEVWSPGNRYADMQDKFTFYEKYGAEEYYILYPEFPAHAEVYRRDGEKLVRVEEIDGFASPRLGLRFSLARGRLALLGTDGLSLPTVEELMTRHLESERAAREQREKAEAEARRADEERKKAEAEAERAAKLAAKLRELGVDPDAV